MPRFLGNDLFADGSQVSSTDPYGPLVYYKTCDCVFFYVRVIVI